MGWLETRLETFPRTISPYTAKHADQIIVKWVFKHQNWTNIGNFDQLEVVGLGSETQLQVGQN